MFSRSGSLLLVLLILRSDTTGNNDFMTRFCLSADPQSQTEKAHTSAPQTKQEQEQCPTKTSQDSSHKSRERLTSAECCVHFSFTLPSSKPSTSPEESRRDCGERVVLIKTTSSLCDDHDSDWMQSVIKAYDWCLMKGYVPKQDSSKTCPVSISQFLDAKTSEDCCYLFSQSPALVFMPREKKAFDVCEQISFNVTLPTGTSDCKRHHVHLARDFIRKTYNCLKWAF